MTIDGIAIQPEASETVYQAACRAGVRIPTLCHRDGLHPVGGCGVCTVEDTSDGRLLPACVTRAAPHMTIATASPAALQARKDALELLLSNHPADCEAPCQLACPSGLPVPRFLEAIAAGRLEDAAALARQHPLACDAKAPCEKACRRKPLGGAVAICRLHRWLAGPGPADAPAPRPRHAFRSRMAGLTEETLLSLCAETGPRRVETDAPAPADAAYEAARCLQCGCRKPDACRLRDLCGESGARQAAFPGAPAAVLRQQSRDARFRFDTSRCVLCGICVRTARQSGETVGPSFHGRGFGARVGPPLGRTWDDVPQALLAACAAACPTGAMTWNA